MWYFWMKIQAIAFIPPYILYCRIRRVPFHMRCTKCHALLDTMTMGGGICEKCHHEMVLANPVGYFVDSGEAIRQIEVQRVAFRNTFMRYVMYHRVAKRLSNGKILDVGCGQGYLFLELPESYKDIYGVDPGKFDIYRASKWVERGRFCIADGQHIPYQSNTFDYVVCTEVLEHLPPEASINVVNECYRILKPGGKAIFSVHITTDNRGQFSGLFSLFILSILLHQFIVHNLCRLVFVALETEFIH
jgi:SAM-dependent methyltransferase